MHRFTTSFPMVAGSAQQLDPIQSHHLAKVLRLEVGRRILLVDGKGGLAEAILTEVKAKSVCAQIETVTHSVHRSKLQLCFALPKGQALDFIFRRATELGLESFQPLQTQYSAPAKVWNPERWVSVVSEVSKQCEELYFPQVQVPQTLSAWLQTRDRTKPLLLCDEGARLEKNLQWQPGAVDLVVGAEGGFSREEVALIVEQGGTLVGLGRNRLRAETAALVAMVLVKKEIGEI